MPCPRSLWSPGGIQRKGRVQLSLKQLLLLSAPPSIRPSPPRLLQCCSSSASGGPAQCGVASGGFCQLRCCVKGRRGALEGSGWTPRLQAACSVASVISHQSQVLPSAQGHHPPAPQDCATGESGWHHPSSSIPHEGGIPAARGGEAEPSWLAGGCVGLLLNVPAR